MIRAKVGLGWAACLLLLSAVATVRGESSLTVERVAGGFLKPVFATSPPGDAERMFILEQHTGQIRILNLSTGAVNATPFLDLDSLTTGNEQGLLGLAFHPNYADNGLFYVNFTDGAGTTNIRRYHVSANPNVADATTAQTVLTIAQPQSNHNGGWIAFDPTATGARRGYLYAAMGDGGGGNDNDPNGHTSGLGNAQDITSNLLGKMLRIDVNSDAFPADANRNYALPPDNPFAGTTGDDEIWSIGLRNPWRNSFDRATGNLYIGDVGQGASEEIDFEPANTPGRNYGWRVMEGTLCHTPGDPLPCNSPSFTPPIQEYANPPGGIQAAVTGGYVYRGDQISGLAGTYFFADYSSGRIWSLRYDGAAKTDFQERTGQLRPAAGAITFVSSFGEDNGGEVYFLDHQDGEVYKIVAGPERLIAANSAWRFLDNGTNQGTDWRGLDFKDESWKTGRGQFGYGDSDEFSTVEFGPSSSNKRVTTYFRREFNVADPSLVASVKLSLLRDDGAAVYLNGEEIARTDNLAPSAAFNTLANFNNASPVDGANEDRYFDYAVDPAKLLRGENVIAVEVHQHAVNSDDVSFDLELTPTFRVLTPGDANQDGRVSRIDLVAAGGNYGAENALWIDGDFTADGLVSLADVVRWQRHVSAPGGNSPSAVPEPATLGLGLVALGLLIVRKKAHPTESHVTGRR